MRPSGAVAIAESISEGLPILKVTLEENYINNYALLLIVDDIAVCNFLLVCIVCIFCQELNLSFGEITGEAALAVAHAIKDKSQLEKLDLNGTVFPHVSCIISDIATAADCFAFYEGGGEKKQLLRLFLSGNCLGEDGCKALKDSMESMNMADVLGSLR